MEEIIRNLFNLREGEDIAPVVVTSETVVFASTEGRFFTIKGKETAQHLNRYRGYIYIKTGRKGYLAHRLVATAFIPNPERKPQINHKNGIKTDNRVENLEWVTNSENQLHAVKTGLKPEPKKETKKYKDGRLKKAIGLIVDDGYSIGEAGRLTGIPYSTIAVNFMRLRNGQKSLMDTLLTDEQKKKIITKPKRKRWAK